jgi:hypothetical protein
MARYDDMITLGRLLRQSGGDLLAIAAECQRFLADPDVLASAVLDPSGAAQFEEAMAIALDGPHGLVAAAGSVELRGVQLPAAVATYQATDRLLADLQVTFDWFTRLATLPISVLGSVLRYSGDLAHDVNLKRQLIDDLQRLIVNHPGILDAFVGASPTLISSINRQLDKPTMGLWGVLLASVTRRWPYPQTADQASGLVAAMYGDGTSEVKQLGRDPDPAVASVPGGLDDIVGGLAYRNTHRYKVRIDSNTKKEFRYGNIDIRAIDRGDGRKSYIVDIPGTSAWNIKPGDDRTQITDFPTNVHGIAEDVTSYQLGIRKALEQAEIRPGDGSSIMLVGHSQGGIVAAKAAGDLVGGGIQCYPRHHRWRADREYRDSGLGQHAVDGERQRHCAALGRETKPGRAQPHHSDVLPQHWQYWRQPRDVAGELFGRGPPARLLDRPVRRRLSKEPGRHLHVPGGHQTRLRDRPPVRGDPEGMKPSMTGVPWAPAAGRGRPGRAHHDAGLGHRHGPGR